MIGEQGTIFNWIVTLLPIVAVDNIF